MKIAFFDFDGTITRHDTFIKFAKFSVGHTRFYISILKSIPTLCLWKLGLKSNSEAKESLFARLYKGMDYLQFKQYGETFAKIVNRDTRPEIVEALRVHYQSGHRIVIVSASIGDWIRPWASHNNVYNVIATEVEVDTNGCLTGRFLTANCHGSEKVVRIKQMFPDIENMKTWAYGDSRGDDEMLSIVNHPNRV